MDMQMLDRLPSCRAIVYAYVISRWCMALFDFFLSLIQQSKERFTFNGSCIKERTDVAFWNNEAVTWRDWEGIQKQEGKFVLF